MNQTKKATAVEKGESLRRMADALTRSLAGGGIYNGVSSAT